MQALFVLYDSRCGVCTHVKTWLQKQAAYVPLHFVPADSPEAQRRFPMLRPGAEELAVISSSGEAWLGDQAWIICLWALREYRSWAHRLASPWMRPLARRAFLALSRNRYALSHWLSLRSDAEIRRQLGAVSLPPCDLR